MNVPFMDLKSEHRALRDDLRVAWEKTIDDAAFVGGAAVDRFEREFAEFCEAKHAVGVGNGTDALILALKALGIGNGDEVITAANSFVATAEAIVHCGATPVFVDIDPATYTIDVHHIEEQITPRTKAVIPVHLYGQPANMQAILELASKHGLRVIEDAAQAHGARHHGRRAGSMGDAACFSFYPAKNLGACGDAGAVVTNERRIADTVRKLRDHGGLRKYEHDIVGYNSRLDGVQAAVLLVKLRHLEQRNELRRQHADHYNQLLRPVTGVVTPSTANGSLSVHHLYVIRLEKGDRNDLKRYLEETGVQTGIHYPTPIHRTPAFADYCRYRIPAAERSAANILSLPMYPEITRHQIVYVVQRLREYMQAFESGNECLTPHAKEATRVWSTSALSAADIGAQI
jgi:dTDP-4-amino-4,6-dideoxygalactose transaminase